MRVNGIWVKFDDFLMMVSLCSWGPEEGSSPDQVQWERKLLPCDWQSDECLGGTKAHDIHREMYILSERA
jgi:hypothetical protein